MSRSVRYALIAAAPFAALYIWSVAASVLYCLMADKLAMLDAPWLQWWTVAVWWRNVNWLVRLYIVASGAIPVLASVMLGVLVFRLRGGRSMIYGNSRWASRSDMRRGGMRIDRRPF